jgi:hypothetical protein
MDPINLFNVKEETIRVLADIQSSLVSANASQKSKQTIEKLAIDVFNYEGVNHDSNISMDRVSTEKPKTT